jgi:hypothetical protein
MIEGNRRQLKIAGTLFPVKRFGYQVEFAKYLEKETEQRVKTAAPALA